MNVVSNHVRTCNRRALGSNSRKMGKCILRGGPGAFNFRKEQ